MPDRALAAPLATTFRGTRGRLAFLLGAAGTLAALYLCSRYNYLLFHTLAELFAVVIGASIFAIARNARPFVSNGYLLLLGVGFGFVAIIDLAHALTYRGMGMYPDEGANVPTQLWIAGRYLQALSLSAAPLLLRRALRPSRVLALYAAVTLLLLLSIFTWRVFPDCYVEGAGLTPFKRISEYVICVMLGVAMVWLLRHRQAFHPQVLPWLIWSIGFTIAAELMFTLYVDVYGITNLLGHYLKILAFACVYHAIIKTGLSQPFALLLREVKQREERLHVAQEAGRIGSFEWDFQRGVLTTEGMEPIYGAAPGTFLNTIEAWRRRIHPEDLPRVDREIARAAAGNAEYHSEFRCVWPDGSVRWVGARGRIERDAIGTPLRMIGVNMDVTERKEFQTELERLVRERTSKLEEMVGELQHVSYAIVHDMRAPLRALSGYAFLLDNCSEAERIEFSKRIMAAARRMDLQIRDALSYTQAVLQEVSLQPVALLPLLREIVAMYPNLSPEKAEIVLADDLPVVWGNEALLTQCFSNLLGNAVKFAKPGVKPQIRVWTEPGVGSPSGGKSATQGRMTRVNVEDNGIGIPEYALTRVFGMFERGHHQEHGNGIGLAIVRKVVERMGGKVGIESEVGKGSRFWVELRAYEEKG